MVRLISRQRGGLAALKMTKLFGIDDFPAAKDSGKVLIIIIYCYLIIIISSVANHRSVLYRTFVLLFSDVVVASDLSKNFGGSTDLAKKRHGSDLHTPIHPPPPLPSCLGWSQIKEGWGLQRKKGY